MGDRGHVYHRLLVLVLVVVLPVRSNGSGGNGHMVVGGLWLESGRGCRVEGIGRRVCYYTVRRI